MAYLSSASRIRQFRLRKRASQSLPEGSFFRGTQLQAKKSAKPTRRAGRGRNKQSSHDTFPGGWSTQTEHIVVNISYYTLTPTEMTLLQRGLSFCPTPSLDTFTLEQELQRFYRSIRLKTFFATPSANTITTDPTPPTALSIKSQLID